jgi:hypothetical protein
MFPRLGRMCRALPAPCDSRKHMTGLHAKVQALPPAKTSR